MAALKHRRAKPPTRRPLRFVLLIVSLAALLGYVGAYANLAATSLNKGKIIADCKLETIRNERLRVELAVRTAPQNICQRAQAKGLVYATQYDYLTKPQTVARAEDR